MRIRKRPPSEKHNFRERVRFAYWPTRMLDGTLVWLEQYRVVQRSDFSPMRGWYWRTVNAYVE